MRRKATRRVKSVRPQDLAELFRALADPTRLRILDILAGSEQCVHEITEALSMEQSAVSHQLRLLKDRNLVSSRKDGRHVHYALDDEHVRTVIDAAREHLGHRYKRKRR